MLAVSGGLLKINVVTMLIFYQLCVGRMLLQVTVMRSAVCLHNFLRISTKHRLKNLIRVLIPERFLNLTKFQTYILSNLRFVSMMFIVNYYRWTLIKVQNLMESQIYFIKNVIWVCSQSSLAKLLEKLFYRS